MNMRTALDVKLAQLQSASGIQDAVAIAKVENQVEDVDYHQGQEVWCTPRWIKNSLKNTKLRVLIED